MRVQPWVSRCSSTVALLALAACSDSGEQQAPAAPADYRVVLGNFRQQWEPGDYAWAGLPFDRLLLRREGCYGTCPVYEVELRRGGASHYSGGAFAPREGEFGGDVGLYGYALLCAAAEDLGLERMDARYAADWTDDETVVIEWERDGRSGSVLDYGRQAPPAFQALRALFDEIAGPIEWKAATKSR